MNDKTILFGIRNFLTLKSGIVITSVNSSA